MVLNTVLNMDTPEQPTTWPPAPTLAPPEIPRAKPLRVKLPKWLRQALIQASVTIAIFTIGFLHSERHLPHWYTYLLILVTLIAAYGGIEWFKNRAGK